MRRLLLSSRTTIRVKEKRRTDEDRRRHRHLSDVLVRLHDLLDPSLCRVRRWSCQLEAPGEPALDEPVLLSNNKGETHNRELSELRRSRRRAYLSASRGETSQSSSLRTLVCLVFFILSSSSGGRRRFRLRLDRRLLKRTGSPLSTTIAAASAPTFYLVKVQRSPETAMSPVSPTQTDDEPPAALPRRSPSRVRFNFKDTFTPLTPATVASDEDGDRSGSSSSTAAKAPGGGTGGAAGLISDPGTPTLNLTEAAAHIRRTLSLGSLTNLLDLATEAVALQAGGSKRAALGSSALGLSSSINDVPGSPALTATPGAISGTSTATSGLSPSSSIIYLPSGTHLRSASAPAGPLSDAEHQAMHEAAMRSATLEAKREQARQTLRDVREAILRPSGEPPRRPADWERVFVLTMLKSTRS